MHVLYCNEARVQWRFINKCIPTFYVPSLSLFRLCIPTTMFLNKIVLHLYFMSFRCCLVWLLVLLWKSATHYIGDRANVVLSLRNLLLHFSCAISESPIAGNLPISSIGERGNVALSLRYFVLHF